ncbi:MAG: transposase [Planctomycetota bacterium]|jgi:hypothetical protein
MPVSIKVPITTQVIEENAACVVGSEFKDGVAIIYLDLRKQNHREVLGLPKSVKLHWSGQTRSYESQELSGFPWPIRYHVTTADAWYRDGGGNRVHYTPPILGLDPHAKVSHAVQRAAVLLIVIGAIGYRRAAWLLKALFQVCTSKSSLARWVKDVASRLPSREEMVKLLDEDKPITEAHLDEIFPRGKAGPGCVLVIRDEYGRIVVTERVEKKDEAHVKAFLEWFKGLGLAIRTFYIDHCETYRKTIPQVFENALIQLDYFHIIQNVWRHIWKYFVSFRRNVARRGEGSQTPWYKARLLNLAKSLWKNRHLLFKSEKNMSDEEKGKLAELCEADAKVSGIRAFLSGVWSIFEDSKDEEEARKALDKLKAQEISQESKHHERAIKFLDESLEQATTYLGNDGVKRNSLAETGMRTLRRLEKEHDGFRTDDSREDFLRIYQAVKYLGWSVHGEFSPKVAHPP